ncbi:MAG: Lrp/AsnC family transcriptional regulator [Thermodesulfobacteriota bacterium]|nr:Lrp/AsnC family transcriptional regulator [Thermodesulfobacteriota bacterium]
MHLDHTDKRIIRIVQGDLPEGRNPFFLWAKDAGMTEHAFIQGLHRLMQKGVIRGFKAIIRHRLGGIKANAMVVWKVDEDKIEQTGEKISRWAAVTHCYERPFWGGNCIFSMIHAKDRPGVEAIIQEISGSLGDMDYKVFWSERELKKTSMSFL